MPRRKDGTRCETYPRTNFRDLVGQQFGWLTVVRESDKRAPSMHILWVCRCHCGTEVEVISSNLRSGNTQSCGCQQRHALPPIPEPVVAPTPTKKRKGE